MTSTRPILRAELVAVGSELTAGETRDTNGGDLARELAALGVTVTRLVALPDELTEVTGAFAAALSRADLVVSTGGLGPTPDDLTREAIAAACGETPSVDPELEAWLRNLFERRGIPMPEANLKQAWLMPGAEALRNGRGTAPGWWVDRTDGRIIVALPGPPLEMRAMWTAVVLPRLRARGLGTDLVVRTLRTTGIGESLVAERLGEGLLRAANPIVATYARADAVDVRISARPEGSGDGAAGARTAEAIATETENEVEKLLAGYVFGRGSETWADVLGRHLRGRRLAVVEAGTGGALAALLGAERWFRYGEIAPAVRIPGRQAADLAAEARRVRDAAGTEVGIAVRAREFRGDTRVRIVVVVDDRAQRASRTVFLTGAQGRHRAALAACAYLWVLLRDADVDAARAAGLARPPRAG
jgi:nicotinamide-nucleotide amidase